MAPIVPGKLYPIADLDNGWVISFVGDPSNTPWTVTEANNTAPIENFGVSCFVNQRGDVKQMTVANTISGAFAIFIGIRQLV